MNSISKGSDTIVRKLLINSAFGIMLMEIAGAITYIIDGIVTSRFIGDTALAASGMAGLCFTILAIISGIISAGAQQLCCNDVGRGKIKEANKTFSMVIFVTLVFSIFVALVGFIFSDLIASLIGASTSQSELHMYAQQYISGFFIGAPAHIFVAVLIPEVQLEGKNKLITLSIFVLTVVDIIGDLLNVTVFDGGMFGMGISTSISYYASALILLLAFFRKESILKIKFKNLCFKNLSKIINIGLPRATKRIGNLVRPLIINRLILIAGGSIAMAAFTVEQNIRYLVESVGVGIGGAVFLLVGMFLGEKNITSIKSTVKNSIQIIILAVGGLSLIYFIFSPLIVRLYLPSASPSYDLAVLILRCHAISLPFLAFNEFYINFVQGMGKYILAHIITLLNKLVYIVILSFILLPILNVYGLWISIPLSEILLCGTIVIVNAVKNKNNKKRKSMFSLFDDVEEDKNSHLELHINSKEQIAETVTNIKDFCNRLNVDDTKTYYLQLFVEEMISLIINHNTIDKKKYHIDIRLYKDNELFVIRTKDNCKPFNATEQEKMYNEVANGSFMGIQMVFKLAKDIKYINSMNVNNFIVTL